ncbi:tRNA epoxyqueuosine(34) reductase QueG [Aestuariivirga sp.]|uniref:tRNA epoxyqueuosine(34) reductase QueG n=1 Tax=Aestuariivirga sp. TaxID=2650926 RepID=UPI0039E3939D
MAFTREALNARARAEGFDDVRVARDLGDPAQGERLHQFLGDGHHGTMTWLDDTKDRRIHPQAMWAEAKSAIVLAVNYGPDADPLARLARKDTGVISVYALNRDYHDILKGGLKRLAQWFAHETGADVKVFVDTAPLMEKPLAARAGLGWQGKHTNLVSRRLGSWFFIGSILTTADLAPDEPESDHCGSCQACLDICPTHAFPASYRLDARRCISYLTIEYAGHIAPEFRVPMGNRIYGCDDCLAVCPWNKFAHTASEAKLKARDDLMAPALSELLALDDAKFRTLFSGSPIKRTGRDRFIRNCLIAAGNSGDPSLLPVIEPLLSDPAPVVRAMAVWASRQLADAQYAQSLRSRFVETELDADVRAEWSAA